MSMITLERNRIDLRQKLETLINDAIDIENCITNNHKNQALTELVNQLTANYLEYYDVYEQLQKSYEPAPKKSFLKKLFKK